jgi:hypothetical protein
LNCSIDALENLQFLRAMFLRHQTDSRMISYHNEILLLLQFHLVLPVIRDFNNYLLVSHNCFLIDQKETYN